MAELHGAAPGGDPPTHGRAWRDLRLDLGHRARPAAHGHGRDLSMSATASRVITWRGSPDNNPSRVAIEHEYIVVYAKNQKKVPNVWTTPQRRDPRCAHGAVREAQERSTKDFADLKRQWARSSRRTRSPWSARPLHRGRSRARALPGGVSRPQPQEGRLPLRRLGERHPQGRRTSAPMPCRSTATASSPRRWRKLIDRGPDRLPEDAAIRSSR